MVVLNYNDAITTIKLLSLIKYYSVISHIIVVDNLSTDNSYEMLKKYENDKIIVISSKKNGGYGYGNNYGVKYAIEHFNADYVLICNPDVSFSESTVNECLSTLQSNPNVAVVAPRMMDINNKKSPYCAWKVREKWIEYLLSELILLRWLLPNIYYDIDNVQNDMLEVDCVPGAMLMVNSRHFSNVGMYDENIFLYGEETVLGIKLKKARLKTFILLNEYFIHIHSVSISKTFNSEYKKRKILWKSRLYVFKEYYYCSNMQILFTRLIICLSLIEVQLIAFIKNVKSIFAGKYNKKYFL